MMVAMQLFLAQAALSCVLYSPHRVKFVGRLPVGLSKQERVGLFHGRLAATQFNCIC